ncbi:MAG: ATP-dependent DNA helicase DinG [Gammaproteobacteria bacterium]|nr:MAG: ATP-dependent DNA helicase DinG [Gammaproteobacteria bacterium]
MLNETTKSAIQSAYSQYIQGRKLRPRRGQREMIGHIARYLGNIEVDGEGRRISDASVCVVEAGTGTGKTLGYLLPSVIMARESGKTLVVSTATVNLQQQILEQEIPLLIGEGGLEIRVALAKGRQRYLCLHKLEQWVEAGDDQTLPLFAAESVDGTLDPETARELMAWVLDQGWDGDLDAAPGEIGTDIRTQITTDHRQCLNRNCQHFFHCPYFKAKNQAEQAHIIVANHDLVFADLALGGGVVLPAPEDTLYVFDEAHHLADKALSHFGGMAGLEAAQRTLRQLSRTVSGMLTEIGWDDALSGHLANLPSSSLEAGRLLESLHVLAESELQDGEVLRYPMGVIAAQLREPLVHLAEASADVLETLGQVTRRLRGMMEGDSLTTAQRTALESALMTLGPLEGQLQAQTDVWIGWARAPVDETELDEGTPTARWMQLSPSGEDIQLCVSPTSAAGFLMERLWQRCWGAILASATLSVGGDFKRFQAATGLPEASTAISLPSPFNYQERAVLNLWRTRHLPSEDPAYLDELAEQVSWILDQGEPTLVLFNSRRHMQAIHERLSDRPWHGAITVQGEISRHRQIEQHKARVEAGERTILFGLASFAEGLDLPGELLTHVVITRLPFSVPDDPVDETFAEWLERRGGNAFYSIAVPDACLKMVQACGRLMRSESDSGQISILDGRLLTRRYGNRILAALPPYRRQILDVSMLANQADA